MDSSGPRDVRPPHLCGAVTHRMECGDEAAASRRRVTAFFRGKPQSGDSPEYGLVTALHTFVNGEGKDTGEMGQCEGKLLYGLPFSSVFSRCFDIQFGKCVSEIVWVAGQQALMPLREGADEDVSDGAFDRHALAAQKRVRIPRLVGALRVVPGPCARVQDAQCV